MGKHTYRKYLASKGKLYLPLILWANTPKLNILILWQVVSTHVYMGKHTTAIKRANKAVVVSTHVYMGKHTMFAVRC